MKRPPLWLAAATVACAWGALYSVVLWIFLFARRPIHEDVRMTYVAAEAGLRYGWSTIYDEGTLRALSAGFPAPDNVINPVLTYVNPPLLAWLFTPLTVFSEPVAYIAWTLVSLAALVAAWWVAAPYGGVARLALLFLAIALWPVMLVFYFGQPNMLVLALLAATWWLIRRERPWVAGVALAAATFLKPQDVALVPVVLLVSGRWRPVASWIAACAALGVLTALNLQGAGLSSWWDALQRGQGEATHLEYTLAHFFGFSPLTYALWAVQGAAAIGIAWWRRSELEVVFAAGIIGTTALAFHFHELDYSLLVLPAWLFLRTSPPVWQRGFLLIGIATMQVLTYGPQTTEPVWDVATHAPQLLFDAAWLAILASGLVVRRPIHRPLEARAPSTL
ncbi:MAG TPA: glycosyltransferase family 87 protein [Candidatus Dormibacteraeota bacterium]|nr:glycosyltransferase family 87 protein [Candidatus Dormibacteraeota bacterium]